MGFQLQEAQFGFGRQGETALFLRVFFYRAGAFSACGREGFPLCLQGFQQVEEVLLGFQGLGTGILMKDFELLCQLGDIIS